MVKNHLKRIRAPRNWRLKRKERKWIARPMPGAHPLNECLTLDTIVKDILHLGKTSREVNFILNNNELVIDTKIRKDKKFSVGLMDIIEIPKLRQKFRVCYNKKGELNLVGIDDKESSLKLLKIKTKVKIKNGKIQLGFHDGKSIILDKCDSKVGDSVLFDLNKKSIIKFLPLEEGSIVLITKGKNTGMIGTVKQITLGNKLSKALCTFDVDGSKLSTAKDYVFVVGKEKQETTVGANK
jgi:small subunit ribosomal protein S4e